MSFGSWVTVLPPDGELGRQYAMNGKMRAMKIGSKGIFSLGMMVLIGLMLLPGSAWARFAGGLGTAEDPWQIATPAQLDHVRDYLGSANADKHFVLIADLDLGVAPYNDGEGWLPIVTDPWNVQFYGHFDGRGHTIRNLFIARPTTSHMGLFGATKGATIKNLVLVDVNVTGNDYVGALAGQIEDYNNTPTIISNVSAMGAVTGAAPNGSQVGGLVGRNSLSTIRDSMSAAAVTGRDYVGGLVGYQQNQGTVANSYATGTVIGKGNCVGGLVGYNNGNVIGSYAIGPVAGVNDVGGLVGRNESAGEIANSYATGSFVGLDNVGGLVGNNSGTITTSYAIGPILSAKPLLD
jgi:hypothetical protein